MGKAIGDALTLTPPNIDSPSRGDLWGMLKTGRSIRNLGKKDMYRLLRWGPEAVADVVAEYFETDLLRATVAARGVFGTFLGPWSAGSTLVLLIRAAGDSHPAGSVEFRGWWHRLDHSSHGRRRQAGRRRNSNRSGSH